MRDFDLSLPTTFEEEKMSRILMSSTSKGDALKWYVPEYDCFVKANRKDSFREYQDTKAEILAGRIASRMRIDCVAYEPCQIVQAETGRPLPGCVSRNFCTADEVYISFESMVETSYEEVKWHTQAKENYDTVLRLYREITGLDAKRYIDCMLVLDYAVCNEDRHINNFGIVKNLSTGVYRFPPHFDCGYSLGFMQQNRLPVQQYLYHCKAKPFSTRFEKQLALVETLPDNIQLTFKMDGIFAGLSLADSQESYLRELLALRFDALRGYFHVS